jgi:oxygen-independent coproporphyrinogen-3 oxidase
MLGLYLHIPFCSAICNYCNFNRGLFDASLKQRYVEALVREITAAASDTRGRESTLEAEGRDRSVPGERGWGPASTRESRPLGGASSAPTHSRSADTVFFGGGTPSLLEPSEVARIIAACEDTFELARDREITLEANPESVTEERLAAYRAAGVNRLSFGVQSFRDAELKRLSRLHGADRARAAFAEARRAGFDNVSLDLMMWLPGQRVGEWLESIDAAIALAPEHLSLYMLEVYPNAPLKDEMARAGSSQAPDEDAAAMYLTAMERLDAAGLEQYEISNVARSGRRARHNLKYWTDGEWLGFGCGAHSTRGGARWKNVASTEEYIARVQAGQETAIEVRQLPRAEQLGDALFTGLRLSQGIDLAEIDRRYGVDVWQRYAPDLEPFIAAGCLIREETTLRLTRRGMLLAHEVMSVFV